MGGGAGMAGTTHYAGPPNMQVQLLLQLSHLLLLLLFIDCSNQIDCCEAVMLI
jgi:hypothetical protein